MGCGVTERDQKDCPGPAWYHTWKRVNYPVPRSPISWFCGHLPRRLQRPYGAVHLIFCCFLSRQQLQELYRGDFAYGGVLEKGVKRGLQVSRYEAGWQYLANDFHTDAHGMTIAWSIRLVEKINFIQTITLTKQLLSWIRRRSNHFQTPRRTITSHRSFLSTCWHCGRVKR